MPFAARICLWPPLVTYLLIALVFLAFILLGMGLRVRFLGHARLVRHQGPGGILFNMVGVLYAVVMASVAVGTWEHFNQATLVAEEETASMLAVARLVKWHPSPSPGVVALRQAVHDYAQLVMEREYPAMARLERSPETVDAFNALWRQAGALEPRSSQESNLQQAILNNLGEAQKARVARLLAARRGLPGSLWLVLAFSSAITMVFSFVFSTEDPWPQFLMVTAVGLTASLVVFAVVSLNYPFTGPMAPSPAGWTFVLRHSQ